MLRGSLRRAAQLALGHYEPSQDRDGNPDRLDRVIRTFDRAGTFSIDLLAVHAHRDELVALCAGTHVERYVTSMLAALDDGHAYLAVLEPLEKKRDLLRSRLRRVRNALVHGNPVHPDVIQSVDNFARYVAEYALDVAQDAFAQRMDVEEVLRTHVAEESWTTEQIRSGARYIDLLPRPA